MPVLGTHRARFAAAARAMAGARRDHDRGSVRAVASARSSILHTGAAGMRVPAT
ncbi:Hypothetical protein A7982_10738 [Minicystis rosea]|nr:Hypothetical protein A7982_10738 [Minicystis rosea]